MGRGGDLQIGLVYFGGHAIQKKVEEFKYLRSVVQNNWEIGVNVIYRIRAQAGQNEVRPMGHFATAECSRGAV